MAKRKNNSPEVQMTRYFDHIASDLVDVVANAAGEFVQVWSAPRGTNGRFVTLSYQRTSNGPSAISSRIRVNGDIWKSIETTGPRRTYYYPGEGHDSRYEEILPSGRLLVQDERRGEIVRETWTEDFDWGSLEPKGKPLSGRAVTTRQKEGKPYFVTSYQQFWSNDELTNEMLACVAEYLGDTFVKIHEPSRGGASQTRA